MNSTQKIIWYYKTHGLFALIKRAMRKLVGLPGHQSAVSPDRLGTPAAQAVDNHPTAAEVWNSRFPALRPLPIYASPASRSRLTMVTDSLSPGSLFGGVGTALILSARIAEKHGMELRIVTRTQKPARSSLDHVLQCNGIKLQRSVDFKHLEIGDDRGALEVSDGDYFLTTSWWTTKSVLGSVDPGRIIYLLQEDERMFYPHGDDWILCNEVLGEERIKFIVNTELLKRHLQDSGLPHLRRQGVSFEPAFPEAIFHKDEVDRDRRTLFFYARPNNLRNLYYRGIEVLDAAVTQGIISENDWDIVFAGSESEPVLLGGMIKPRNVGLMSWADYARIVRSVDVGICLMATPHPSYPPLDLAASGAVVLTNSFGLKDDLSSYSRNILCESPSVDGLLHGLKKAIALSNDREQRYHNYATSAINRSWAAALEAAVDFAGSN
jgi:O-antigen biosynthesis protein